ncbi:MULTISPECIES: TrbI/VirB10 family protein [unclassified Novosphingobium]|uniref:TrbI/VirB10 family protein n=1 Tax=unclassified Novosphingobium TaxID=2644732 RepID=UPI00181C043F|nr:MULTISPECIES: TrbI/VirB10 family protein [unclassified Novosphingobium]NMN04827.1 type IV secretion system protein VirB10 [Novosphingobium sp. SG919]NMN85179.1 type IV secretion system protein VirB10 [Novosphingobium sp. SG916]
MTGRERSQRSDPAHVANARHGELDGACPPMENDQAPNVAEPHDWLGWARAAAASVVRLRPAWPSVERLSRKAVLTLTATSVALVALAIAFGLQGGRSSSGADPQPVAPAQPGDLLAKAPRDYTQVPRLAPVLPGDVGQAGLKVAERNGPAKSDERSMAEQIGFRPAAPPAGNGDNGVAAMRQRRQAERDAARQSRLFAGEAVTHAERSADNGAASGKPAAGAMPPGAQPHSSASSVTDARQAFLDRPANAPTISTARLMPPGGPAVLQAGSVIPAALITGLRSDLPGQITAQVTQNVYDSLSGAQVLVPQGARLIGEYDAAIAAGQRRALLVWTRLILPDGRSLDLDRLPGTDPAGQAGLEDRTDFHWGGIMRAAAVSTLLAVGAEWGSDSNDALVRALRQGGQDSVNRAGTQIVARALDVPPTLTIRPGYPVRVLVTRDLVFDVSGDTP